ncbi:MAG: type IV pilus modification protein PilV [Pseudomonadota bacterium]
MLRRHILRFNGFQEFENSERLYRAFIVKPSKRYQQNGFTLLEILITMVIMAFGLLALSSLQNKMQMTQLESYQRAQALILLQDMADRINANYSTAANYVTGTASPLGTGDSQPASCTSLATGVTRDQCEWSRALKGSSETLASSNIGAMIGARGCVEQIQAPNTSSGVCAPGIYRVSVAWQGVNKTSTPSLGCGAGLYGESSLQRVIATQITIGLLNCS